jgi:hypothetical protein
MPSDSDPNDNMPNDNMPNDNDPDDDDDMSVAIGHLASLAKDGSGGLFAVDVNEDTVLRLDRTTGGVTLVSGKGRGSGPEMNAPNNMFREADGRLLISTVGRQIYRVDPGSGDRTLLVDLNDPNDPFPNGILGILATSDGTLFIAESVEGSTQPRIAQLDVNAASLTAVPFGVSGVLRTVSDFISAGGSTALTAGGGVILRVELPSGNTTLISREKPSTGSSPFRGEGPGFRQLRAIALADDGTIFAGDEVGSDDSVVFRVDPSSGDRTIVSGPDKGTGPQLRRPRRLVVFGNDQIAMLDDDLDGLLIINAQTGDRTLLTVQ